MIHKRVRLSVEVDVSFDASIMPDDDWRKHFYSGIKTHNDLAEHIARNHVACGICTLKQLDGFADKDNTQATFSIRECEVDDVSNFTPMKGTA